MTTRSKIYIPPVDSARMKAPSFNFVFSDDIDEEKKRTGGRIDKNSWG